MTPSRNVLLAVLLLLSSRSTPAQNTCVDWVAFSTGYQGWDQGNTALQSVVGQDLVGSTMHPTTRLTSGFLAIMLSAGALVSAPEQEALPRVYSLDQNYPNPFNPSTTIGYGLPLKSAVRLEVFNTIGQRVRVLVEGEEEAGYREVKFDATGLSTGVYFYRLTAGEYVTTKRLLLLR